MTRQLDMEERLDLVTTQKKNLTDEQIREAVRELFEFIDGVIEDLKGLGHLIPPESMKN